MKTVQECLETLGVESDMLKSCDSVMEEFAVIKRLYREKVLASHPDKGGDPEEFRKIQTSFTVLREKLSQVGSFLECLSAAAESFDKTFADMADMPVPSWDFFATAAEEGMPTYRIELAKSGRSKCKQKGKAAKKCGTGDEAMIPKDSIRIGVYDEESGKYWQWNHLQCWRVPSKVWLGLPQESDDTEQFLMALSSMDQMLVSGFDELSEEDQEAVVEHCKDHGNWAKLIKRKKVKEPEAVAERAIQETTVPSSSEQETTTLVPSQQNFREAFVIPVPGENGARPDALAGKTFVLTGLFPEVGGGSGLSLGRDRVKAMIESFGGRVTSAISGKTDVLVVGKEPGLSKVTKARDRPNVQLVSLKDLKEHGIEAACLENANPAVIQSYSAGYTRAITASASTQNDSKKPAKKKRKKTATPKEKATKGSKAAKTGKTKKGGKKTEKWNITCDGCGVDCTSKSWFVETDETDWCEQCMVGKETAAVMQVNGKALLVS